MRGRPLRIEIGPKDIEAGKCVIARRDNGEKIETPIDQVEAKVGELLEQVQHDMFEKAKTRRDNQTFVAHNMDEFRDIFAKKSGFVKAMWCGDQACEDKIK